MPARARLYTVPRLSIHLPLEAMPKDTRGWLQEDWVDTGEALMSHYNFAAEQHFWESDAKDPNKTVLREEGGYYQKIKLGKNITESHL